MPKYLFIDESGDPGYKLVDGASSKHYVELALQLDGDNSLSDFIAHIISWKYVTGKLHEIKQLPKGKQGIRYLAPILELYYQGRLKCSCVYLLKDHYKGPYLKPDLPTGYKPLYFRNFIHMELLRHHFNKFPLINDTEIHLIFDDYPMRYIDVRNAEDYLQKNWNIPNFWRILHANSISTVPLQVASQLVTAIKDIVLGTASKERRQLLSFIAMKDITGI